jgi:hypothetical protein
MQADQIAVPEADTSFYLNAKESLADNESFDWELESELDHLMAEEHKRDEEECRRREEEIEQVMFPQEVAAQPRARTEITPSEFTEFALRIAARGDFARFSFDGRRYLKEPYDTSARRVLLKAARQTEKCVYEYQLVLLENGAVLPIRDLEVGDRVVSLSADGSQTTTGTVTWKSERYKKPCLRIKTQQNLQADVATTHPMRLWGRWVESSELREGDRIASLRRGGQFTGSKVLPDDRIKFAAYMIGDGDMTTEVSGSHTLEASSSTEDISGVKNVLCSRIKLGGDGARTPVVLATESVIAFMAGHAHTVVGATNGTCGPRQLAFTQAEGPCLSEFEEIADKAECASRRHLRKRDPCVFHVNLSTHRESEPRRLFEEWGLWGKRSPEPHFPDWVWDLNRRQSALFLNRLWATDGSVKHPRRSQYEITYSSISRRLIKEVQRLLWKFGIPSRIRENEPTLYRGTDKKAYVLRVQTQEGVRNFLSVVGALGKSEGVPLSDHLDTDLYWDRIIEIEELGDQWCYDISVDEGESFVVDGLITHNSTQLGNKSLSYCGIVPGFKVLYVTATATQARVFSVDRLKEPIDISPELSYLVDSRLSQNVLFKQFKNRSQVRVRYAFLNADRVRGIPSDLILIDEIQDIIFQNVPIIEQCASHSHWKLFCYSGTPKSLDNTIEVYWSEHSTQNEWVVPCEACGASKDKSTWYWNVLGARNIGKTGPICTKCGRSINPMHPDARWASMQPVTEENADRVAFEGFRINQLMVPWIVGNEDAWYESVLFPYEYYGRAQFNNEVLGLSYDSGQRPLTQHQVQVVCQESIHMYDPGRLREYAARCNGGVAAGLDHGSGEKESYSVLSLGGYMGGEFQIFFSHRFVGEDLDPRVQLLKIASILQEVNFKMLGADYGGGFDRNDWLMRNFGPRKVMKYQYAASPKKKIKWQPELGRFILHRTEVLSDLFNAIKNRKIWLPNFEEYRSPYIADMLNIFSEYNKQIHMIQYKLSPGKSDDTLHSILYCFLASMFIRPRPDILVPVRLGDVEFTPA